MFLGGGEKGLEQLGEAAIERKSQGDRMGTSMNRTIVVYTVCANIQIVVYSITHKLSTHTIVCSIYNCSIYSILTNSNRQMGRHEIAGFLVAYRSNDVEC